MRGWFVRGWFVRGWFTGGKLRFSPTGVPGVIVLLVEIEVVIGAVLLIEIGVEIGVFCGANWFTFWW